MSYQKPEVAEVYDFLRCYNALIVHFSGDPKGAGWNRPNHMFPVDLQHVITGNAMGGVSCSVVKPGDNFHTFGKRNALGTVGVILGFQSKQSLVAASHEDCGSYLDEIGRRQVIEKDIAINDLELTLSQRVHYNEWVVRDYKVLGIFVALPITVSEMGMPEGAEDVPEAVMGGEQVISVPKTVEAVGKLLSDADIYTFNHGGIYQLKVKQWVSVDHKNLYIP